MVSEGVAQLVEQSKKRILLYNGDMVESGLWHLSRKQATRKGSWVQILLSPPVLGYFQQNKIHRFDSYITHQNPSDCMAQTR